mgnify:FL=1
MPSLSLIRPITGFFLLALILGLAGKQVLASQGIAQYGKPKYADGFSHFDYVNPNAPRGGTPSG